MQQLIKRGLRKCYSCKKIYSLDIINFHSEKSKSGGYGYICRKCFNEKARIREKTPEFRKKRKIYQSTDGFKLKRNKRLNNPIYKEKKRKWKKNRRLKLRFKILKRDKFTCQYCGKKPPEVILEIDHIFPKSKGGLDKIENYRTACRECNIGKGDSILEEFNI